MPQQPGPALAVALALLLLLALAASRLGHLRVERQLTWAAGRAVLQLALVSLIITAVLGRLVWSAVFVVAMLGVAVLTSSRRIGAPRAWPWVAVAVASGCLPVLFVIFVSGAVPLNGASLVPMAGIIIGGAMTASSLTGRRTFAALRDEHGCYEAALSLGLERPAAITEVVSRHLPEASFPDWTRPEPSVWSPCPGPSSVCCWVAAPRCRPGWHRLWSWSGCWPLRR